MTKIFPELNQTNKHINHVTECYVKPSFSSKDLLFKACVTDHCRDQCFSISIDQEATDTAELKKPYWQSAGTSVN